MNIRFAWILGAAILAGCSGEWSTGLGLQHAASNVGPLQAGSGSTRANVPSAITRPPGFAGIPDRGDLLHYPAHPVIRRAGGHAWHAALPSEAHALAAIVAGRMRITAPDGTLIALDYVRHVEHPDGNWSWIGRHADAPGRAAVVTFGPDAVFGSIPQGRELAPLNLTMVDGAGWVVSAGPRHPAEIRDEAARPTAPGHRAPPAGPTPTIDVLVGYTRGFASARGGTSVALTRIHNLIDSANEAYADRQVGARLRLVHSMQVAYPDATTHAAALEAVAGLQSNPEAAINALHAARDRHGADMVVLLRQSLIAGNDGCARAWREEGGGSRGDPRDDRLGYFVVADGPARGSDGQTRFCGEVDFARALGQRLGRREDAASVAAFRASADALTVPKGDVDANGTTDLTWFKPGTLDAWLMNGPIIQGRVTHEGLATNDLLTVEGQFNDTPNRDLAWRQYYDDRTVLSFWWDGPDYLRASPQYTMSASWRLQASGDRDGDGISDLYWRSAVDGRVMYWEMQAAWPIRRSYKAFAQSLDADLLMVGDFNGDRLSDLFFRTRATGATEIWFPDGDGYTVAPRGRMSKYWRPVGAADYDGDGDDDLVWRSSVDSRVLVWIMQDGLRQDVAVFPSDSDRQLLAVGYLDANRRLDLVWRRADGSVSTWLNTGGSFEHRYIGNRDASWRLFTGGR